jgi:hypothetical protein
MSACFFLFESFAFDCFCEACFCTDFGDLSPMVGLLSLSYLTFGMFVSPMAFVTFLERVSYAKPNEDQNKGQAEYWWFSGNSGRLERGRRRTLLSLSQAI